jgi:hypothetical protein
MRHSTVTDDDASLRLADNFERAAPGRYAISGKTVTVPRRSMIDKHRASARKDRNPKLPFVSGSQFLQTLAAVVAGLGDDGLGVRGGP